VLSRGRSCAGGLALVISAAIVVAAIADGPASASLWGAESAGPLTLVGARLHQSGPELTLSLRTAGSFRMRSVGMGSGRLICLDLRYKGREKEICVQGQRSGGGHLVTAPLAAGQAPRWRRLAGRVHQTDANAVKLRFRLDDARLRSGGLGWRVITAWRGDDCPALSSGGGSCWDAQPTSGTAQLRLIHPRVLGCRLRGPAFRRHGPRLHRVALTFDDGPSRYTSRVLHILRRFHATATFFVIGNQIPGRERLLRRMIRAGDEIGNHTFDHRTLTRASLRATNSRIHRITGYRPCVARAPEGHAGGGFIPAARRLRMTTIQWDVDPSDYEFHSHLAQRVLPFIRPGSVVVMHDGGGNRAGTVAALPKILRALRARHLHAETVTEVLGGHFSWTPR
jgi:peptidoglycan-N-acetylglucosamine deacetylase